MVKPPLTSQLLRDGMFEGLSTDHAQQRSLEGTQ